MRIFVLAHSLKRTRVQRRLALLDLPRFVVEQGFAGLEVSDRQFAGRAEAELHRFAASCARARCGLIFDINADLTAAAGSGRDAEIAHARSMTAVAALLGAECLRLCLGGQTLSVQRFLRHRRRQPGSALDAVPALHRLPLHAAGGLMRLAHSVRARLPARVRDREGKIQRASEAMRLLAAEAGERGLRIGIENHWGISADPAVIVRIIMEVGSPWLGACPDLGNFPRSVDPEKGLLLLAPHAVLLHAKSYGFTAAGHEKRIAYARLLPLFHGSGFAGPITVEFEGLGDDLDGCLKTRDLVRRFWPA